jgi:hypothetical protein
VPVDEQWKARVDEVFATKDLTRLFRVAASGPEVGLAESRDRIEYLADALYRHVDHVEWAARETDAGDLTEREAIDRTLVLQGVASRQEDDWLYNAPAGGLEQALASHRESVRRAFGGRSPEEVAQAAYRRLSEIEAASPAVGGTAARAAFAGLGQVRPGQAKATPEAAANEAGTGVEAEQDAPKPPTYGKPTGPSGPVVDK